MTDKNINGYILNLKPNQIVDRDIYVTRIRDILQNKSASDIIVIVADTAVGKTSLVDKALFSDNIEQTILRIRTLPINDSDKTDEWMYFNYIFKAFKDKYSNDNENSFSTYINSFKNKSNNKEILSYIIDNMFNNMSNMQPIVPIVYLTANWYFKLGRFDINYLLDDNSIKSRRIKYQYIKYILEKNNIIIAIDNIQNIDSQSLNDLINLISETQLCNIKYIFEFTLSEKKTLDSCQILCDHLAATSVKTELLKLEKLDKKHIIDAVSKHLNYVISDWNFNIKLQQEYERINSGNIREMLDFSICFSKNNKNIEKEYTYENIVTLPETAKVLLAFIINCNGVIKKDTLLKIGSDIQLDINESLQILIQNMIVEVIQDEVKLSHASIGDYWNRDNNFENYNNIAYNYLIKHYKYIIDISKENTSLYDMAWLNLIQLYYKYDAAMLIEVFEFLDKDYKKVISPQNAWMYISQIIAVTEKQIEKYLELYLRFIKFCFESELYDEGYSIIKILEYNNFQTVQDKLILYEAMYLSALDQHSQNIIFCENHIKNYPTDSKVYINLKLISLSSYRSLGMLDECYKIHKEFLKNASLKKQIEWGYFLRLSEMYLDRKESPKFLRKSVKFFEKNEDYIQAGKSLISYSYIIASQGKLKLATKQINLAQRYLKNKRMGNHMFLVNNAAIQLLGGNHREDVWEMLSEAEITANVPFDKLAIINNKLVWCIENNFANQYKLLISEANKYLKEEPDYHIHGLIYYNIYYLLKKQNNPLYEDYLIKAREMKKYCKPVSARLDNKPTPETKFALTKPWHVCFLAYWTYDLQF